MTTPYRWYSMASGAAMLALWSVLTLSGLVDERSLPSPVTLAQTFADLLARGYSGSPLWSHVGISIFRALAGFSLAILIGVPLGLLIGRHKVLEAVFAPIIGFFRPIPPIAFITLFVFYFGIGEGPKIGLIFMACLWYVVLNSAEGVRNIPDLIIRAGENIGLTRPQLFFKVVLPAALPAIMTAIRAASSISWTLVVASELIGAQAGLGFMILDSAQYFNLPVTYVGIIIIGLIGLVWELAISAVQRRVLHWQGK